MNKIERINKLQEVSKVLKSEFVGLDSIIDQIISSVTPWYVTPEIVTRPVIVSLWGMTGTGKSSVVRRLVDLLGTKEKSMFVDCGEITGDGGYYRLSDKINEFLFGDIEDSSTERRENDAIFIFDEFQYARTLDSQKNEIEKAAIRPIWSLIDSGKLDLIDYQYGLVFLKQFVADLGEFVSTHPDIPIENCMLTDKTALVDYINELGYFFYDRDPVDIGAGKANTCVHPWCSSSKDKDKEEEKEDPYAPVNILSLKNGNPVGLIYRGLNRKGLGEGKKLVDCIFNSKSLTEIYRLLLEATRIIGAPKIVDCSKSLIFIIGNLDEAFQVEDEVSPDMSADIFNDITSKVTINDIKTALQDRFRAEQVARLGNNLIKYPTLRSKDFEEIIKRELERIFNRFKEESGVEVKYGQDIINLAYSEGVFPTQGVRPVFTTIITLLTPILSEIILWAGETGEKIAFLETKSEYSTELEFRVPKISLIIKSPERKDVISKEVELKLELGNLRYPENRKRRFSTSVHEIGHAILNCWCTGNIPVNIVSVATDEGGFCDTYDPEKNREIQSIEEIKNSLMISMAGYQAEVYVFGDSDFDSDKVLTGSSDDLRKAWGTLSKAAYSWGLFGFYKYAIPEVTDKSRDGIIVGNRETFPVDEKINNVWNDLLTKTRNIIESEHELLKQGALMLSSLGSITKDQFKELIERYGNRLTLEKMEEKKKEEEWYKSRLENL